MKVKLYLVSLCATALLIGCAKAPDKNNGDSNALLDSPGPVPEDWYRLPEDGAAKNPGSLETLEKSFSQILSAQAESLNSLPSEPDRLVTGGGHPPDWVPWHLALFTADFGISSSGLLGPLFFDGSRSIQAVWVKRENGKPTSPIAKTVTFRAKKSRPDLMISQPLSSGELAKKLEPSIMAALSSKKIKNEKNFRKNVLASAERFNGMAYQLANLNIAGMKFRPVGFRLELAFGVEGDVSPGIGIGGEVSLRFDWKIRRNPGKHSFTPTAAMDSDALKLATFARSITPDINAALEGDPFIKYGFKLEKIKVGLGATAEFNIGIAKGTTEVIGGIDFGQIEDPDEPCYDPDGDGDCHPQPVPASALIATADDEGLLLIDGKPKPEHLKFASIVGASATPAADKSGIVTYRIKHQKFQKGLKRAISMGRFFTKSASLSPKQGRWWLQDLEVEYGVSLAGDVGMTTLGGLAEIELEFEHLEGK